MQMPDGTAIERTRGTPQGGPISPLLANLFLHYGFDLWISWEYPGVRFERFADDAVIHCVTERQAWEVRESIGRRFADIGLSLHPEKTKIVYGKDSRRHRDHPVMSFTFCGYAFRPRKAFNKGRGKGIHEVSTCGRSWQVDGYEPKGGLVEDTSAHNSNP